jgi:hypothetical protein
VIVHPTRVTLRFGPQGSSWDTSTVEAQSKNIVYRFAIGNDPVVSNNQMIAFAFDPVGCSSRRVRVMPEGFRNLESAAIARLRKIQLPRAYKWVCCKGEDSC